MIKGDAKYHLEISENKDITFVHLSVINSILELLGAGSPGSLALRQRGFDSFGQINKIT